MTEYIKYSERNSITDPFLAKLFDYLERVAGWEIQDGLKTHSGHTSIVSGPLHLYLFEERVVFTVQWKTQFEMILPLFQQEYTCLLANYKY